MWQELYGPALHSRGLPGLAPARQHFRDAGISSVCFPGKSKFSVCFVRQTKICFFRSSNAPFFGNTLCFVVQTIPFWRGTIPSTVWWLGGGPYRFGLWSPFSRRILMIPTLTVSWVFGITVTTRFVFFCCTYFVLPLVVPHPGPRRTPWLRRPWGQGAVRDASGLKGSDNQHGAFLSPAFGVIQTPQCRRSRKGSLWTP